MRLHLERKAILPVKNPGHGLVVECESGILWVTQMHDGEDHILKPGERFVAGSRGAVVVECLQDGWVSIRERNEAAA